MALNYIWIAFFVIGFIFALGQLIFLGNTEIFNEIVNSTFANAKTGFEISLGLTGVLTLWMGLMKIGENGGMVRIMSEPIRSWDVLPLPCRGQPIPLFIL